MNTLLIRHVPESDPPAFMISRGDAKIVGPVAIQPPFGYPVEGRPDSDLMQELQWYLEKFLEYPFPPATDRAERILKSLDDWGTEAFKNLFGSGDAGNWYHDAEKAGLNNLRIQIISDKSTILQWPWEAMKDPRGTYLAVSSQVERGLTKVHDPKPIPANLPKDRLNILLVTARPHENDVHYRSISRPLVELIEKEKIPAVVDVLRPPTFDNLDKALGEKPGHYHIIHFDGHGGYSGSGGGSLTSHVFEGKGGVLVFEDEKGEPDEVSAEKLGGILSGHVIPIIVLNACQSGMQGGTEDPFASVAAALIKAGVRGVTAMAYSLYVSGAQEFLPAFYAELFASGDLSQATRKGRLKMFKADKRVCARGRHALRDFIVPVFYQQQLESFSLETTEATTDVAKKRPLPNEASDKENPYGFIGRDLELLKLERAILKDTPSVLIHGLGGVGKSTLARGFVKWLNDTGGMDACLWLTFKDVRSAEFVINDMGGQLFGKDFLVAGMDQKLAALSEELREKRIIIVWDNFEVVAGIEGTHITPNLSQGDRTILLGLLKSIRGGKSKVIITSRSEENWLGIQRMRVSIGGLIGEERWEYCEKILVDLGITVDRDDEDLANLMDFFKGHPLAMRVILPRLQKMSAGQVLAAVKSNMEALGPEAEELYAALKFEEDQLPEELRPLLIPLSLHEQFVDSGMLFAMAKQIDETRSQEQCDEFCTALASAGLLRSVSESIFEMHPALTSFLKSTVAHAATCDSSDTWSRAFVDVMGSLATALAPHQLHKQRFGFHVHGANFHNALSLAEGMKQKTLQAALVLSLAVFAQNTRDFAQAGSLFEELARLDRKWGISEGEAAAYHHLGMIAQDQRDFKTAERWYDKSLAISEKQGNERHCAITYHQLGMIAHDRRDFKTAEQWYLKSLATKEKQDNEHDAALTYHHLGITALAQQDFEIAEQWCLKSLAIKQELGDEYLVGTSYHLLGGIAHRQSDYKSAERWYLKALAISEKQGSEYESALAYHHLGKLAQDQRNSKSAEQWYLKSLAIKEKLGDKQGAADTYHQLGIIALEQRDFKTAQKWNLKSLTIVERQGNEHGAASGYHQLAMIASLMRNYEEAGRWHLKAIRGFVGTNDDPNTQVAIRSFVITSKIAPPPIQAKLRQMWDEAGLGEFPEIKAEPEPETKTDS